MTRRHRIVLALLAAALPACDGSTPTGPAAALSGEREVKNVPALQYKEEYSPTGTIGPGSGCPEATLRVALAGGGKAPHIGRYTITNSHWLSLNTGGFNAGTFLKVAANGDHLIGTYAGLRAPLTLAGLTDFVGRSPSAGRWSSPEVPRGSRKQPAA